MFNCVKSVQLCQLRQWCQPHILGRVCQLSTVFGDFPTHFADALVKSVGDKSMGEMPVSEESVGENSVGSKYMGEKSVGENWVSQWVKTG